MSRPAPEAGSAGLAFAPAQRRAGAVFLLCASAAIGPDFGDRNL